MVWNSHFVNAHQTKEMRQSKYNYVRANGYPCDVALRVRDWTIKHMFQFVQLMDPKRYS